MPKRVGGAIGTDDRFMIGCCVRQRQPQSAAQIFGLLPRFAVLRRFADDKVLPVDGPELHGVPVRRIGAASLEPDDDSGEFTEEMLLAPHREEQTTTADQGSP